MIKLCMCFSLSDSSSFNIRVWISSLLCHSLRDTCTPDVISPLWTWWNSLLLLLTLSNTLIWPLPWVTCKVSPTWAWVTPICPMSCWWLSSQHAEDRGETPEKEAACKCCPCSARMTPGDRSAGNTNTFWHYLLNCLDVASCNTVDFAQFKIQDAESCGVIGLTSQRYKLPILVSKHLPCLDI